MTERYSGSPQQLVLDTNVVLDLVVFGDPGVRHIGQAIRSGAAVPLTTRQCLDELRRVLAYPALKLDSPAQNDAFERFCAQALLIEAPVSGSAELPRCADADDQKFLELALHSGARFLLTKDKALLRMARAAARLGNFEILHPSRFVSPT
jgi:putative PIN family toxin of toxin-antitoxin system